MYVVTACLQGTLLAMGVYFEYINPKKTETVKDPTTGEDAEGNEPPEEEEGEEYTASGDAARASEQTPLLQGSG